MRSSMTPCHEKLWIMLDVLGEATQRSSGSSKVAQGRFQIDAALGAQRSEALKIDDQIAALLDCLGRRQQQGMQVLPTLVYLLLGAARKLVNPTDHGVELGPQVNDCRVRRVHRSPSAVGRGLEAG